MIFTSKDGWTVSIDLEKFQKDRNIINPEKVLSSKKLADCIIFYSLCDYIHNTEGYGTYKESTKRGFFWLNGKILDPKVAEDKVLITEIISKMKGQKSDQGI